MNEPTPLYNATLRSESCSLSYFKQLNHTLAVSEAFADASMLGSVWLRQRGLGSSIRDGGIGPFEWSLVMSTLMQSGSNGTKPLLSPRHNSYQLFKAMLQFFAGRDLLVDPLVINSKESGIKSERTPILFDGTRGLNILFKMSRWSYRTVSQV